MALASILVLSWNHEAYIEQSITSFLSQTHKKIEIIYIDNCSKDNSYEIAKVLLEKSNIPFLAIKNETPQGIVKNLNKALSLSKGEYIAVCSTDDWFREDYLEKKISLCNSNPQIGCVYSKLMIHYIDTGTTEVTSSERYMRGHIYKEILNDPTISENIGSFYTRRALVNVGAWDENQLIEDMDLNIRISLKYEIDYVDEPLFNYRKNSSSISANIDYMVKGFELYYEKYKKEKWADLDKFLSKKYRDYAAICIDRGEYKNAYTLLRKSLRLHVISIEQIKTFAYLIRRKLGR